MTAAGQTIQVLKTEKAGWFQDFQHHGGTVNVIDGFADSDKDRGLDIKFFESVGDMIPFQFPHKYFNNHPKSDPSEAWLVTANDHYDAFFKNARHRKVLAARVNVIALTEVYPAFPIINLLLDLHGKPPFVPSDDEKPCDLRAPIDEAENDQEEL